MVLQKLINMGLLGNLLNISKYSLFISFIFLSFYFFVWSDAEFFEDPLVIEDFSWNTRLDACYAYNPRAPSSEWDPIQEGTIRLFQKVGCTTTFVTTLSGFTRQEGNGIFGSVGVWHDWNDYIFTYTALSKGSNSVYLPKFRIDNDINIKFGSCRQFVVPLGFMYYDYYQSQSEIVLSTGLNYYIYKLLLSYRLFWHLNNPGSHQAISHKIGIDYTDEGNFNTSFSTMFGREAFDAIYLVDQQFVNRASFGFALAHRQWVGRRWGILAEAGYVWVESPYVVYRACLGIFKEW